MDTNTGSGPETVELPAPTAWPMVLALGVSLVFASLVTNPLVRALETNICSGLGSNKAQCGGVAEGKPWPTSLDSFTGTA